MPVRVRLDTGVTESASPRPLPRPGSAPIAGWPFHSRLRACLADRRAPRGARPAVEGVLPAVLQRSDPPEGRLRDRGRRARVHPALHRRLDLPEAALGEARLGQPRSPLVRAAGVRLHAAGRLPLHLQARLPGSDHAGTRSLAARLCSVRRLRGQGDHRPAASLPAAGPARRGRTAVRRPDRGLVHERRLAVPSSRATGAGCRGHERRSGRRRRGRGSGGLRRRPAAADATRSRRRAPAARSGRTSTVCEPTYAVVHAKVESGGGGMPSFRGQLSPQQIEDVAAFVSTSAG